MKHEVKRVHEILALADVNYYIVHLTQQHYTVTLISNKDLLPSFDS